MASFGVVFLLQQEPFGPRENPKALSITVECRCNASALFLAMIDPQTQVIGYISRVLIIYLDISRLAFVYC
jgi:hypothetical protein